MLDCGQWFHKKLNLILFAVCLHAMPLVGHASGITSNDIFSEDHATLSGREYVLTKKAQHMAALFDGTAPNGIRVIEFRQTVRIRDVMLKDEPLPPRHLRPLYIHARASKIAMSECELIVQQLANHCALYQIDVQKRSEGKYLLIAQLAFNTLGHRIDTSHPDNSSYMDAMVDLSLNNEGIEVHSDHLHTARADYYGRAKMVCDAVRKSFGSCVVETIYFETRPTVGNDPRRVYLTARAQLGALVDQTVTLEQLRRVAASGFLTTP
ncbi:hypothetical protein [Pseudaestuariivita rosea]|uniref:hypothetical protein n=1 Tax=Pseudaestuariivita rosea TaxID=2763263 RepID=UPI001ABB1AB3|nr:hypothetical protein [Pseudaestuariivita rosea]